MSSRLLDRSTPSDVGATACLYEPEPEAHPPAGAERQQLEVLPPEVDDAAAVPPKNLSGTNSLARSYAAGSWPMAQALTSTCMRAGTWNPRISVSAAGSRGTSSGSGACSRSVSFTTAFR